VLSVTICTVAVHERHHLQRALELSASHPLLLPILAVDVPCPDRFIAVRLVPCGLAAHGHPRNPPYQHSPRQVRPMVRPSGLAALGGQVCVHWPRARGRAAGVATARCARVPSDVPSCPLRQHFLAGDDERPQLAEWEQGLLGLPPHLSDFVNDLKRALEPAAASLALCLYEMACAFKARRPPRRLPAQLPVRRQRDARSDAPHADTKGAEAATYARGRARARALHASRRARAQGAETRANTSAWPPPLSEALLEHAQQVSSAFRSYDYLLLDRDPNPIPESPRMYESPRAAPRKRSENRESLTL